MASKKPTRKDKDRGCKTGPELRRLLSKAQTKIAKLQERQRAGTLPQVHLDAKLTEIKEHLDDMEPFDVYTRE